MAPSQRHLTLGLIQMACEEDPKKNLDRALTRVDEAAELFRSRYFCQTNDPRFFELAETVPGPTTELLGRVAKEHRTVLIASLFEKAGEKFYNTACVLDADGRFLGKYRKVHIPDDPQNYYSEYFYFTPGDLGFKAFETRYAKIGVQVCWDQWFPEGARALALQGAEILFYPTAIGWQREGDETLGKAERDAWVTVQRGHAISNTVFVAAANRIGVEDHLNFWGNSFVADPLGRVLGQASSDREENLLVELPMNRIEEVRKDWPFLKCRRDDAYPS
jgi:N-carbamoylputrescine amidase